MLSDEDLLVLYEWIDSIPLSREKKNIARDFCDGVLTAEIMKHYYPKMVDLHNYPEASSTKQKLVVAISSYQSLACFFKSIVSTKVTFFPYRVIDCALSA